MRSWSEPLLGLRLLALSVVVGSAAFLPGASASRSAIVLVIGAGIVLSALQHRFALHRWSPLALTLVVAQIATWTFLVQASGGKHSPFFVGYLLEVPLVAVQFGRRGALVAGTVSAIFYVGSCVLLDPPFDLRAMLLAVGFLAIGVVLSWLLVGMMERQEREIELSHAALGARAQSLAAELRLLGEYLDDALFVIDDRGRIASVNPAGAALCGVDRDTAIGRPWQEVLRPDRAGTRAIVAALAEGSSERGADIALESSAGAWLPMRADVWTSAAAGGRTTYVLLGGSRTTDPEADPLRRLGVAVACVSHQFKNSIQALQSLACGVEQGLEPADRAAVRELRSMLHGLGSLADDMLAMSGPRPSPGPVRLCEVLDSALQLSHCTGSSEVLNTCPRARVRGHRGEIIHAFFNLLDNAGRASAPGQPVRVRVHADARHVYTEIEDTGPGVPAGLAHGRMRVTSGSGSGYGLLAARQFLERNHGDFDFAPLPRGGTVCRVRLVLDVSEELAEPEAVTLAIPTMREA